MKNWLVAESGALVRAIATLPRDPKLSLEAATPDGETAMVSPSFAIVVGTIDDTLLPLPRRKALDSGLMTIFGIHPNSGVDIARLVLRGAFGDLAGDPDVDKTIAQSATIRGPRRRIHAMLDGEDTLLLSPCTVEIRRGEVQVYVPRDVTREMP